MDSHIKNTLALLSEGLIGRLRKDCAEEWKIFTEHRFVQSLAQGNLAEKQFKNFLIQDYLYLIEYARAEALMIFKSNHLKEMRRNVALLSGLLEVELPLHIAYCKEWGISEEEIDRAPRSLELIAYTNFMLGKGMHGDLLDLMTVMIPCLVGYGEIGLKMLISSETRWENNPYQSWIKLYGGEDYIQILNEGIKYFEEIGKIYGAEGRYKQLLAEFRTVVKLESLFWESGSSAFL